MPSRLTKLDLTLLAMALAEGKPLSPVQLQKSIFLLQKRLPGEVLAEEGYEFIPHNYGPFSGEVYDDVRTLAALEYATVSTSRQGNYQEYGATQVGNKYGESLIEQLPVDAVSKARDIVKWVRTQPFSTLVSSIYKEYPEYRVNSVFKG